MGLTQVHPLAPILISSLAFVTNILPFMYVHARRLKEQLHDAYSEIVEAGRTLLMNIGRPYRF